MSAEQNTEKFERLEPTYINDDLLRELVDEQGPQGQTGIIAREEGIEFETVRELRLDYQNLLKIDNLWCFTSLVKLQLDNNIIERIENLEELVNLEQLDLSFNHIEVIEGLHALTKLEDLTLFQNNIRTIENLEMLDRLLVFSIGNNALDKIENLLYLRRFKRLRSVTLKGNPICETEMYREYVASFLPALVYLDSRPFPEEGLLEAAQVKYGIASMMMDEGDNELDTAYQTKMKAEADFKHHSAAFVENLGGPELFDAMYEKDFEAKTLHTAPPIAELVLDYRTSMIELCNALFQFGLARHAEREADMAVFDFCTNDAIDSSAKKGMAVLEDFLNYKQDLWYDLEGCADLNQLGEMMGTYFERLTALQEELIEHEMLLVDQLEDALSMFTRSMNEMVTNFLEFAHTQMSAVRTRVNAYHDSLIVTINAIVENIKDAEGISEKVKLVLLDKDMLMGTLKTSQDMHLLHVDTRDDKIIKGIHGWLNLLVDAIHDELEVRRNRKRLLEIFNFCDFYRDEGDDVADYIATKITTALRRNKKAASPESSGHAGKNTAAAKPRKS